MPIFIAQPNLSEMKLISFKKTLLPFLASILFFGSSCYASITKIEIDHYGGLGSDPFADNAPWGVVSTETISQGSGSFSIEPAYPGNPDYNNSIVFSYNAFDFSRWIYVSLSADLTGTPLGVYTFENAERFPFNTPGLPGLDYVDTGFGFNSLNGKFEILDLVKDVDNNITSLSATFFINDFPAPAGEYLIGGRIFFNVIDSNSEIPEPGMSSLLLAAAICVACAQVRKRQKKS